MPDHDHSMRIDVPFAWSVRVSDFTQQGVDVGASTAKREIATRAPRPTIVKSDNSPSCSLNCTGKVEILLIARQAVKQNDCWMRTGARRSIEHCIHQLAIAEELQSLARCGMYAVEGRISINRRRLSSRGRARPWREAAERNEQGDAAVADELAPSVEWFGKMELQATDPLRTGA
jgi:hypothetical protein